MFLVSENGLVTPKFIHSNGQYDAQAVDFKDFPMNVIKFPSFSRTFPMSHKSHDIMP